MSQIKYKLSNWAIVTSRDPYIAPELVRQCLMGKVEGHPDHEDGKTIVTSNIIGKFEGRIVTKTGSLVELGDPRPEYDKEFPDSKKRLFASVVDCTLRWDGSIR